MRFPSGSVLKTLPAMQETWVWSLGWEDLLEEEMATHSSCLEYPMDRGAWCATVHGVAKESDTTDWLNNNKSEVIHLDKIFLSKHSL